MEFDENKDGELSRDELEKAFKSHQIPVDCEILFQKLDLNKNDRINNSEFLMGFYDCK